MDAFFADRAARVSIYDAYIEHNIGASSLKIMCKFGCSRCCHQVVQGCYAFEIIDLYLACVKSGVIFVPINILYRDREMSHILCDAEKPKAAWTPRSSIPCSTHPRSPSRARCSSTTSAASIRIARFHAVCTTA